MTSRFTRSNGQPIAPADTADVGAVNVRPALPDSRPEAYIAYHVSSGAAACATFAGFQRGAATHLHLRRDFSALPNQRAIDRILIMMSSTSVTRLAQCPLVRAKFFVPHKNVV